MNNFSISIKMFLFNSRSFYCKLSFFHGVAAPKLDSKECISFYSYDTNGGAN